jgi:hypothetical protein
MRHSTLLLLLFAVTLSAEVRLGPESAVTPPDLRPRTLPQIARRGANEVIVWHDAQPSRLEGTVNGIPFDIRVAPSSGQLSVAAGDENFVLVWTEPMTDYDNRVKIARFTYGGQLLDLRVENWTRRADIAYGGSTFMLAFEVYEKIRFVSMNDAGEMHEVRTLTPWRQLIGPHFETLQGVVLAWNGREFIAAFYDSYMEDLNILADEREVWFVRVDGGEPQQMLYLGYVWPERVGFTAVGSRVTAAIPHPASGGIVQRSIDGTLPAREEAVRAWPDAAGLPKLVWNGSEYVLAWTACSGARTCRVLALRLDASAQPIDAAPVVIAETRPSAPPSLVVVPEGVKIVYERTDAQLNNVVRIFTRTLERLPPSRKRAVR